MTETLHELASALRAFRQLSPETQQALRPALAEQHRSWLLDQPNEQVDAGKVRQGSKPLGQEPEDKLQTTPSAGQLPCLLILPLSTEQVFAFFNFSELTDKQAKEAFDAFAKRVYEVKL